MPSVPAPASERSNPGLAVPSDPSPLEAVDLARHVHRWLRPDGRYPVRRELPFLLDEDPRTRSLIVREGGEPVAHAALHHRSARLAGKAIEIGIIGAVATAPHARGRGYARQLIQALQEHAAELNLDLLLLWDEHGGTLYPSVGFEEAGIEIIFSAHRDLFRSPPGTLRVRRMDPATDLSPVRRLYDHEPGGLFRSSEDWRRLIALPGTDFYVLIDSPSEIVVAYGVIGKGSDLTGCIHEWCGPVAMLPPFLAEIFRRREDEALWVMSPPWRQAEIASLIDSSSTPLARGALGMMQIGNRDKVLADLSSEELSAEGEVGPAMLLGLRDAPMHPAVAPGLYVFGLDSM